VPWALRAIAVKALSSTVKAYWDDPGRTVRVNNVRKSSDMATTVSSVQSLLLSTRNVDDFLGELAVLATGIVDPPASVGITVCRDGQPFTVAATDERAAQADETQYSADRGPCIQTLETGLVVEVTDQRVDDRWGEYSPRAAELGVRCSLSLPLMVSGSAAGALNLYGYEQSDAFSGALRASAEIFAEQASTALTLLLRQMAQAEETQQLEQALTSRTVIDQALGVVMGQQRCTADAAFALLRMHSQNTNRKLRDVAAELIERQTGQPPSAPHSFQRTAVDDQPPPGAGSTHHPAS